MKWPFSLPFRLEDKRQIHLPVDWAYSEYQHIILLHYDVVYNEPDEFELWCQQNFCYYFYDRVLYDCWAHRYCSNGIGGWDGLFLATNYDNSAVMAKLRWC